jgi:ElaB/YqjD/DUF883 family membrane-anchored ribosome-binding protein
MSEKDRIQKQLQGQLAEFDTKLEQFDDEKVAKSLAALRDKAKARLAELADAGEDKYEEIRDDVTAQVEELRNKIEKA